MTHAERLEAAVREVAAEVEFLAGVPFLTVLRSWVNPWPYKAYYVQSDIQRAYNRLWDMERR